MATLSSSTSTPLSPLRVGVPSSMKDFPLLVAVTFVSNDDGNNDPTLSNPATNDNHSVNNGDSNIEEDENNKSNNSKGLKDMSHHFDEILFDEWVEVKGLHIIPQGHHLQVGDKPFLGRSAKNAPSFVVEIFGNNNSHTFQKEKAKEEVSVSSERDYSAKLSRICPPIKIVKGEGLTKASEKSICNRLIVKGNYRILTLCVYGEVIHPAVSRREIGEEESQERSEKREKENISTFKMLTSFNLQDETFSWGDLASERESILSRNFNLPLFFHHNFQQCFKSLTKEIESIVKPQSEKLLQDSHGKPYNSLISEYKTLILFEENSRNPFSKQFLVHEKYLNQLRDTIKSMEHQVDEDYLDRNLNELESDFTDKLRACLLEKGSDTNKAIDSGWMKMEESANDNQTFINVHSLHEIAKGRLQEAPIIDTKKKSFEKFILSSPCMNKIVSMSIQICQSFINRNRKDFIGGKIENGNGSIDFGVAERINNLHKDLLNSLLLTLVHPTLAEEFYKRGGLNMIGELMKMDDIVAPCNKLKILDLLWIFIQTPENLKNFLEEEHAMKPTMKNNSLLESKLKKSSLCELLFSLMTASTNHLYLVKMKAIINRIKLYDSLQELKQNLRPFAELCLSIEEKIKEYLALVGENKSNSGSKKTLKRVERKSNEMRQSMSLLLSSVMKGGESFYLLLHNLQKEFNSADGNEESLWNESVENDIYRLLNSNLKENQMLNIVNLLERENAFQFIAKYYILYTSLLTDLEVLLEDTNHIEKVRETSKKCTGVMEDISHFFLWFLSQSKGSLMIPVFEKLSHFLKILGINQDSNVINSADSLNGSWCPQLIEVNDSSLSFTQYFRTSFEATLITAGDSTAKSNLWAQFYGRNRFHCLLIQIISTNSPADFNDCIKELHDYFFSSDVAKQMLMVYMADVPCLMKGFLISFRRLVKLHCDFILGRLDSKTFSNSEVFKGQQNTVSLQRIIMILVEILLEGGGISFKLATQFGRDIFEVCGVICKVYSHLSHFQSEKDGLLEISHDVLAKLPTINSSLKNIWFAYTVENEEERVNLLSATLSLPSITGKLFYNDHNHSHLLTCLQSIDFYTGGEYCYEQINYFNDSLLTSENKILKKLWSILSCISKDLNEDEIVGNDVPTFYDNHIQERNEKATHFITRIEKRKKCFSLSMLVLKVLISLFLHLKKGNSDENLTVKFLLSDFTITLNDDDKPTSGLLILLDFHTILVSKNLCQSAFQQKINEIKMTIHKLLYFSSIDSLSVGVGSIISLTANYGFTNPLRSYSSMLLLSDYFAYIIPHFKSSIREAKHLGKEFEDILLCSIVGQPMTQGRDISNIIYGKGQQQMDSNSDLVVKGSFDLWLGLLRDENKLIILLFLGLLSSSKSKRKAAISIIKLLSGSSPSVSTKIMEQLILLLKDEIRKYLQTEIADSGVNAMKISTVKKLDFEGRKSWTNLMFLLEVFKDLCWTSVGYLYLLRYDFVMDLIGLIYLRRPYITLSCLDILSCMTNTSTMRQRIMEELFYHNNTRSEEVNEMKVLIQGLGQSFAKFRCKSIHMLIVNLLNHDTINISIDPMLIVSCTKILSNLIQEARIQFLLKVSKKRKKKELEHTLTFYASLLSKSSESITGIIDLIKDMQQSKTVSSNFVEDDFLPLFDSLYMSVQPLVWLLMIPAVTIMAPNNNTPNTIFACHLVDENIEFITEGYNAINGLIESMNLLFDLSKELISSRVTSIVLNLRDMVEFVKEKEPVVMGLNNSFYSSMNLTDEADSEIGEKDFNSLCDQAIEKYYKFDRSFNLRKDALGISMSSDAFTQKNDLYSIYVSSNVEEPCHSTYSIGECPFVLNATKLEERQRQINKKLYDNRHKQEIDIPTSDPLAHNILDSILKSG